MLPRPPLGPGRLPTRLRICNTDSSTRSGTSAHIVKVFNFHGKELSRSEPYSSFLGQNRGSPISATAFHPHRMVMGAAARGDHHINVFSCTNEPAFGTNI